MRNIYNNPTFLRMYWRALQELVNGPLNVANSGPLMTPNTTPFVANGLSVENPNANIEPWLPGADQHRLATGRGECHQLHGHQRDVSNNVAYVTGTAPVNVATVWINGAAYPLTWTSLTNWTVRCRWQRHQPVQRGGRGPKRPADIAGDSNNVSVVYNGTNSPVGQVVINEIMYAPAAANAQFVELYNNSTNTTYDLSGWQFQGLSYTFPNGSHPRADQLSGSGGEWRGLRRRLRRDQSGV
jgi:hypothetical protein